MELSCSIIRLTHFMQLCKQVRTRDDKFKVVIERKLYDSHGSGRLDGSDYERGTGSSLLSILGGLQSPTDDPQDSYSWASRLGELIFIYRGCRVSLYTWIVLGT